MSGERSGELRAARLLLDRGAKQLETGRPTEAIRSLGRALTRLYKHESRHELVTALYLCGVAYEQIGLPWAARGSLINAASIATNDFWSYEEITRHQVACCNQLKWVELRLGRLPQTLAWHELDRMLRNASKEKGFYSPSYAESENNFDAILGILILRSDLQQLAQLVKLPDVLSNLGLPCASTALRYALGAEESVGEELDDPDVKEDLPGSFMAWRDQPAGERLPERPQLYEGGSVRLASGVLGCRITVECENVPACVGFAESILGAVESLLSTGTADRFFAHEPTLDISVRRSESVEKPFRWSVDDGDGCLRFEVRCGGFGDLRTGVEAVAGFKDRLGELAVDILARVFFSGDVEKSLTKLFRDDRALERAIDFGAGYPALGNLLADPSRSTLSAWLSEDAREHPVTRSEVWDAKFPPPPERQVGGGPNAARELLQEGRLAHSQIRTASIIRMRLWDRAGWKGAAFWRTNEASPYFMGPIFENHQAAEQIFRLWSEELGEVDDEEQIRITILRGIDRNEPMAYRMIFAAEPGSRAASPRGGIVNLAVRMRRMDPESLENLDQFEDEFRSRGFFKLACAVMRRGTRKPDLFAGVAIAKRRVFIRYAWEIGPDDVDAHGIVPGDDPIIPSGVIDAPVLGLSQRLAGRPIPVVPASASARVRAHLKSRNPASGSDKDLIRIKPQPSPKRNGKKRGKR